MLKPISKYIIIAISTFSFSNDVFANQTENNFLNSITISGFIHPNGGGKIQKQDFKNNALPDAQKTALATNPGTRNIMVKNPNFANDSKIIIKATGQNKSGIKYGAIAQIDADLHHDGNSDGVNISRTYAFTESKIGKFEIGNNIGANQKMKVGPAIFARAAGGINGKYLEYINLPMLADTTQTGVVKVGNCDGYRVNNSNLISASGSNCSKIKLPHFILIPSSPISHGGYAKSFYSRNSDNDYNNKSYHLGGFNNNRVTNTNDGSFGQMENATKLTYYSPRISGLQAGATFTPNTEHQGSSTSFSGNSNNDGYLKNIISWGVNYSENFDNLGVALSATGEYGKFESNRPTLIQRNNLKAYEIGAMATFAGFTLGGSYGSWNNSLQPKFGIYSCDYNQNVTIANQDCSYENKGKKFNDSTYLTAGGAYEFGPFATSITYIKSDFQFNKYEASSFGVDYKMSRGLMPYIEITKFKFKSNQAIAADTNQLALSSSQRQVKDNNGYVTLAGVLLAF